MARDKVTTVEILRTEFWQIQDYLDNQPDIQKIQTTDGVLYKDSEGKNLLLDYNGYCSAAPELIKKVLKRRK